MHASPPVDSQHNDSYFVIAHFHYVLFGGSIFGLLAATYFWFPKITGRMLNDKLGKVNFWATFFAFNMTFFPMHFLGLAGMPRRQWTYSEASGFGGWSLVVSIGAFLLGGSFLIFIYNLLHSLKHGEKAGNDPWDAATLEWAIPSPPPAYNFATIPQVTHRDQLWWDKYGGHDEHGHAADDHGAARPTVEVVNEDRGPVHLPNPSFYPLITAAGLFVAAIGATFGGATITIGLLTLPVLVPIGAIILLLGAYGWAFEPAG
jgi:cytochrome c oxidase subunit 1